MSDQLPTANEPQIKFPDRLKDFRRRRGLSGEALAKLLEVQLNTVRRWEAGAAKPSESDAAKLTAQGFGNILTTETNLRSRSRIKLAATAEDELHRVSFDFSELVDATAPSWFRNGPPDQDEFYKKLVALQMEGLAARNLDRLSLIENYKAGTPTTQSQLEDPKPTAAAWNSNYGSHGWHRYVGRFPAHVVRALLNHFGATSDSVVCDPFCGSGTTAVECRLLGVPFVGIEICSLSRLISEVKAGFQADPLKVLKLSQDYKAFMQKGWQAFIRKHSSDFTVADVLAAKGDLIPPFANSEKWFTPEAMLGVALTVHFANNLRGFEKDILLVALSAKMRSIGNVDVDVVRAEYSKKPRSGVSVVRLIEKQLKKMAEDIARMRETHPAVSLEPSSIQIREGSALEIDLPLASVDFIITSPPYGVEALSYLRTHLLSYRSLAAELEHDPYETRAQTIGSEYLEDSNLPDELLVSAVSPTFVEFFSSLPAATDKNSQKRRLGMMKFFEDMHIMGQRMASWLKDGGRVAFTIGNKRLGDAVIPTDVIIQETFKASGFAMYDSIRHKLKTNNSNSQVPWQERVIQEESILLFKRESR